MIHLKILDKHGRELCDGDTIKTCSIRKSMQEEGDYGYQHQVDTIAKWELSKIDVEKELEENDAFFSPWQSIIGYGGESFRDALCDLGGLPSTIDDDEFKECVFDYICHQLDLDCKTLEELEFEVEGFEIVEP